MAQNSGYHKESPSQTAGPYVQIGCTPNAINLEGMYCGQDLGTRLINVDTLGNRISIKGQILDGAQTPIRDGIVEIWQADHAGFFNSSGDNRAGADPNFTGWGRQATDFYTRSFMFETICPGQVPWNDGRLQAPHICFWIAARGVNLGLHTRMYFPEFKELNAIDPVLSQLEHQSRIPTLVARKLSDQSYEFNIVLQGDNETIFFDV